MNKRNNETSFGLKAKIRKISLSRGMNTKVLQPPVKSCSDKKEYRHIQLHNGLKALLVQHFIEDDAVDDCEDKAIRKSESDVSLVSGQHDDTGSESEEDDEHDDDSHKEKMAAVALCIGVGSFRDPKEIQGLSHFLEHMIFMGSEKYPKENEFDQFVSSNGGADNAMTECEYTMFYFEIVEEHLAGAVDRFAQLFISPLMLRDSMDREMEAVESEFQNNIADDDTRIMQICASIANGPASNFTWGNLRTLKEGISNEKLYTAVHEFRRRHYLANRMCLCVESALSLDELQKIVEDNFSAIKSGQEPEPLEIVENVFNSEFFNKIFYVKPKADKIKLYMSFLLPSMDKHYKSKPHDYLAYLIQHEGLGSLSSYLKKRLLALRVEAGTDDQSFEGNSMFSLFTIVTTLTENGLKNIETVLEAVFSYLLVLKETSIQDHEKAFMELKQIRDISFKYREEKTATENVEELAVSMKYYEENDLITGREQLLEFDANVTRDIIERLNKQNFNLLFLTDQHEKYEKTEKWFGTEYDEIDVPQKYIELWENRKVNAELLMPVPNQFICTNFELVTPNLDSIALPKCPQTVFSKQGCEVFYKLDTKFKLPHAFIYVYLVSPKTVSSVRDMTLTSLYSMIVKHYMTEKLYPAVCAGLGYALYSEEKGMVLKLSGYNEKLPLLIDIITKELKNIGCLMEADVFQTYRRQFKKLCHNNLIESKFLNKDCRLNIIEENHKFFYDRYVEADKITFENVVHFAKQFPNQLKIQVLVQGNLSEVRAIEIGQQIVDNLSCDAIDNEALIRSHARMLPAGTNVLTARSILRNNKNSTTTNYVQLGFSSIRLQCLIEFIEKIMEEPLFDILRTKEQLGYSVSCSHRFNCGILGMSVTVQSQEDKNPTTVVNERIDKFLNTNMVEILEKMSDQEFTTVQNALMKLKRIIEVELETEVNRHWAEIVSNEYIFDRLELEAQMISKLTKSEVVEFYKKQVLAPDAKKLSIQIVGDDFDDLSDQKEQEYEIKFQILERAAGVGQNVITDIERFKNSLEIFPFTKTII